MDKVWVPDANNFRLRICIAGHCGIAGGLSFEGTERRISEYFLRELFEEDIKSFCCNRLHFRVNDKPFIPRPLGEAVHGTRTNQVLHYDSLYIQKRLKTSNQPFEYALVLKDDFSGFVEFIPASAADHCVVSDALLQRYSRFGMPFMHVSDQGSHLKTKSLRNSIESCKSTTA